MLINVDYIYAYLLYSSTYIIYIYNIYYTCITYIYIYIVYSYIYAFARALQAQIRQKSHVDKMDMDCTYFWQNKTKTGGSTVWLALRCFLRKIENNNESKQREREREGRRKPVRLKRTHSNLSKSEAEQIKVSDVLNCLDFALQVIRGAGTVVKGIFDAVQKAAGKSQESWVSRRLRIFTWWFIVDSDAWIPCSFVENWKYSAQLVWLMVSRASGSADALTSDCQAWKHRPVATTWLNH